MNMATHQTMIGGIKIPSVGLGTARFKDEEQPKMALNSALELGYRHLDTAYVYRNEAFIGKVLKEWFSSGKLKREDIFITTKLPPDGGHADLVEKCLKESLEKLQLAYVDLYLIHQPFYRKKGDAPGEAAPEEADHIAVWKKMEEQVDAGRAKTIGLSNFSIEQIQKVWDSARIKPANLQIRLTPYLQKPELIDFCHKKNIVVVGYSTLGGQSVRPGPSVLEDETIKKIAEKHKGTPAQVILRYFVQNNIVMIPKSVTPSRLKENLDVYRFSLDADDLAAIKALDKGEAGRMLDPARR